MLVLDAAAFALIARVRLRWMVPHDAVRILAAVALCFLPGTWEVLGNLANLHSVLFYATLLVALQDPERPLGPADGVVLLATAVSAGEGVLLAPVFLLRGVMRWRDAPLGHILREGGAMVALSLVAAVNTVLFRQSGMPASNLALWPLSRLLEHVWSTLNVRYVLHPVLGDGEPCRTSADRSGCGAWCGSGSSPCSSRACADCLAARACCCCSRARVSSCWSCSPGTCAPAPPSTPCSVPFAIRASWRTTTCCSRSRRDSSCGWWRWGSCASFAAGLCVAVVVLAFPRWSFEPWGPEKDWARSARHIREARATPGADVRVPINPRGWDVVVHGAPAPVP